MLRAIATILAATVFLAGCSVGDDDDTAPQAALTLQQSDEAPPHSDVADVVEDALKSVVNVRVEAVKRDLFGGFEVGRGEGSGVVIDRNGTILTNNHVIEGATEVSVAFNDDVHDEPLDGRVVATVPEKDIAVVQVDADDLVPIKLGNSSKLRLGDPVLAIGFPLGLGGPTVTQGIISGTRRTVTPQSDSGPLDPLEDLLQTDAAINPGNSGGALIDFAGRLVGINTAAASAGTAENIGFAIAIDEALNVVEEILSEPADKRAWLGVYLASVDSPSVALQLGLDPDVRGALIVGVVSESPADDAGLSEQDVIIRVGDTGIESDADVTDALKDYDPGEEVEVEVVSASGERTVEVALERRPAQFP